jgi:hypothetical protein
MKARFFYVSAIVFLIAFGLSAAGYAKRASVADPLGNVTLVPPYPADYPEARTDKISVQYAVIAIARQTGIQYDWDTSFKNTDPVCRQWITPVILRRPFPQALEMILKPVNLKYTISNGKIILGKRF